MRHFMLVGALGALFLFAGCVHAPVWEVEHHVMYVDREPPPQKDESAFVMNPPGDDYVWLSGYWYWTGATWIWVGGRWALPPASDHVWVTSGWVIVDNRYRYVPGRWARRGYVPHYRYAHPPRQYIGRRHR